LLAELETVLLAELEADLLEDAEVVLTVGVVVEREYWRCSSRLLAASWRDALALSIRF
jgi:hypothetical protein